MFTPRFRHSHPQARIRRSFHNFNPTETLNSLTYMNKTLRSKYPNHVDNSQRKCQAVNGLKFKIYSEMTCKQ